MKAQRASLGSDSSFVAARLGADGLSPLQSVGHKGRGKRTAEPIRWIDTLSLPQSSFALWALACDLHKPLSVPGHQAPSE